MDEPALPLVPPKWDETDAVLARAFFQGAAGQKFLQRLRYERPNVTAKTSDDRRTEHENLQGYEKCWTNMFRLLGPQN